MPVRVVALTLEDPRTCDSGGRIRDFHILSGLTELGTLDLLCFGSGARSRAEMQNFVGEVHLARRGPRRMAHAALMALASAKLIHYWRYDVRRYMNQEMRDLLPGADIVYCSLLYNALHVLKSGLLESNTMLIWDTQNFDPDVWELKDRHWPRALRWLARHQRRAAIAAVSTLLTRADLVLACTTADYAALIGAGGSPTQITLVDNAADTDQWAQALQSNSTPWKFALFGSLDQEPTLAGALWFLKEVWPGVAASNPFATLVIAGRRPGRELRAASAASARVTLVADPPSLVDIAATAERLLIPQKFGSGSKIKLFEALASGRPVIANNAALTGLSELPPNCTRAETAAEWIDVMSRPAVPDPSVMNWVEGHASWRRSVTQLREAIATTR